MSGGMAAGVALLAVLACWGGLLFAFRAPLGRLWREPVLRHPVLIIESDDWGPGPPEHAARLVRLCELLGRHRDATGRAAVMTVGVVLGVPDNAAIRASGYRHYHRRTLLDEEFRAMRGALEAGRRRGVLALQLHGLEHLWPDALLHAISTDPAVRRWVDDDPGTGTEALPSPLQSRWTDGSRLPSRPLPAERIAVAVAEEAALFCACFGAPPRAVVPPTFVWNDAVERGWAAAGARVVVTPGRRYTGRDATGRPAGEDRRIANGDLTAGGALYVVRDVYFEPGYGHRAERAAAEACARWRLGRPALLETHRFNFTGDEAAYAASLREVDALLTRIRRQVPEVRFMSTAELADALRECDPSLVEGRSAARAAAWVRRAATVGRLRKLAWVTGLAVPMVLGYVLLSWRSAHRAGAASLRAAG